MSIQSSDGGAVSSSLRSLLIGLPFVLLLMMLKLNPSYIELLWTHPLGQKMSAIGIGLMIVGALVIRKIIDIKV